MSQSTESHNFTVNLDALIGRTAMYGNTRCEIVGYQATSGVHNSVYVRLWIITEGGGLLRVDATNVYCVSTAVDIQQPVVGVSHPQAQANKR